MLAPDDFTTDEVIPLPSVRIILLEKARHAQLLDSGRSIGLALRAQDLPFFVHGDSLRESC